MKILESAGKLIEDGWNYDVLFGKGLANHLPMAVTALERMGGDRGQIERFANIYVQKLEPVKNMPLYKMRSIEENFGKRELFSSFLVFFKNELEKKGIRKVLNEYLDRLFPGVSASAFHALIRLAYALEINSTEEVAISLAFWSSEFQNNGKIKKSSGKSLFDIFNDLNKDFKNFDPGHGIISEKIASIVKSVEFKKKYIQPDYIELRDIALLAIKLYLTSGDFILLHGVTASHALRIVLPFVKDKNSALRYFWISLLAAILISDFKEIERERLLQGGMSEQNRINKVFKSVLQSIDDHTIKIVYSCWQEFLFYGNHDYISGMERRLLK